MSNLPDQDPIGHAAKFLWILAIIPVIFGSMTFFLPPDFRTSAPSWAAGLPFVVALLIALVGLGVHRRIIAAAWFGIALFSLGLIGLGYAALMGDEKKRGMVLFALLLIWPIKKLFDAVAAMRVERGQPPS